jgi:hypothetical protein
MPKYLLLKHYTGGPERHPDFVPMSEWTEDEITAHMAFQRHVAELLRKPGRVRRRAGAESGWDVRPLRRARNGTGDHGRPVPETKELAAGWFVIDVESEARTHEVAVYLSSAPGKDGAAAL